MICKRVDTTGGRLSNNLALSLFLHYLHFRLIISLYVWKMNAYLKGTGKEDLTNSGADRGQYALRGLSPRTS